MRSNRLFTYLVLALGLLFSASCIKNDIPYPRSLGAIKAFEVQGQIGQAVIDSVNYTVTLTIADTVNLANVKLLRLETSDNVTEYSPELSEYISLAEPYVYTLNTYPGQSYAWQIIAVQNIERYIRADGQVGKAEFNVDNYSAAFYISGDLRNVKINEIQLGPSNSVISPDPREIHDFTTRIAVTVSYRDVLENWTISAYIKTATVTTGIADAWANHAYLNGTYVVGTGDPTFSYRKASETAWTTVPTSDVSTDDTDVSAHISGLSPNTEYVFKTVVGDSSGEEVSFTTENDTQMINMNFDDWFSTLVNGKNTWFPDKDLGENFWWDSGNQGANTLGEANPTSPEETFVVKGKAARMETVSVIGVMAGGNVFSGQFVKTNGIGAIVNFGRPFTSRPSKLHGYYSYEPKTVGNAKDPYKGLLGKSDRCHIFVMMFDMNTPYTVNTTEKKYLPPYSDPCVIGYADLVDSVGTGGQYKEFNADIVYKDSRKPGYCAVVAVASYYADYFTGGVGSLMYADEFSFIYDDKVVWEADLKKE